MLETCEGLLLGQLRCTIKLYDAASQQVLDVVKVGPL
jgi:hypothetical protein